MIIGVALDWSGMNPIKALFWSAVLNGVAAVPIMVAMMIVAQRKEIMGRFTERPVLMVFGWGATAVMAAASGAMLIDVVS
jgi:Mn2+/Fe2+ NRAMP family transporter